MVIYWFASLAERGEAVSCISMFHSSYQPKFYLIFPEVSSQYYNHSYFAAHDFAEQLFCETSFADRV